MVQVVWEYVVREQFRGQFELTFGPGGAWSKIYADAQGFMGITLLREIGESGRYLVFEIWKDEFKQGKLRLEDNVGYTGLMENLEQWTESREEMGTFRMLAEGTIRARGKSARRKK